MAKFSNDALKLLRNKILLFDGIEDRELSHLLNLAKKRSLADGELLINEGALATRMYIVISGQVVVTRRLARGHERIAVLSPGSTVGEMGIIDCAPRSARVVASGDSVVLEVDQEVLDGCPIQLRGKIYRNLAVILARRLRGANLMMENISAGQDDPEPMERRILQLGLNDWSLSSISAKRVDLSGADLRESDLRGADLRGVDFRGADLRGAQMDEVDLRDVDLDGAIMDEEVIGASGDAESITLFGDLDVDEDDSEE
jgi:CRP-like cAMP-binding protein